MHRFIIKKTNRNLKPLEVRKTSPKNVKSITIDEVPINDKNKNVEETKTDEVMMNTQEKITLANAILAQDSAIKAKKIRKDKGLIEKTESSAIILTEDNKELLKD